MWKKIRSPLLFFSLGMNIAFLIVIVFFYVSGEVPLIADHKKDWDHDRHDDHHGKKKHAEKDPGYWFYKHKIGVSDTQWKNIRPGMEQFHSKAYTICKKIRRLRNEVLQLIEDTDPHAEAIQTKQKKIIQLKSKKQRIFVQYMDNKKKHLNRKQEKMFFGMLQKDRDCEKHARFLEDTGNKDDYDEHDDKHH